MDRQAFEELKAYTDSKLKLSEANLFEKSISLMSSHHYYLDLYVIEFRKFKDMLAEKEKLYGILYVDLRKNSKIELKYKSDYDSFINSNELYYEMMIKINEQEAVVKYLEEVMNTIRKMSFNISNIIELKKLKEGIS